MSGAISVSPTTIGVVGAFAVAAAVAAGEWTRRRINRTRDHWRTQDQLEGWRDARGHWHRGVIDVTFGWDDGSGHHAGLDVRVEDLESDRDAEQIWRERHERRHGAAP